MAGDFNYDLHKHDYTLNAPLAWHSLLYNNFTNCICDIDPQLDITTFRRGTHTYSLLNYIYAGTTLRTCAHSPGIQYLNKNWSDHSLLAIEFTLSSSQHGKGTWRANPTLTQLKDFRQCFAKMLTELHPTLDLSLPPQSQWKYVKTKMTKFIKQYSRQHESWRQKQLRALQHKRNRFLRDQPSHVIHAQILPTIEVQISSLQKEITDILAIRSGTRWRKNSEVSAGYLQRTIQQRQTSRYIAQLQHINTGETHNSPEDMQTAAFAFYQSLYTMGEVDDASINSMLNSSLGNKAAFTLSEKQ
ncbi:hypothetical protein INT45_009462 [Circinella minor]|uniref:Endonuclease/exonuclease/phosphatase domain-containing protein n=1 Tax=Circinella minor TaxID=1195481 RepID=A0A8H7V981_9FUNG|nr:hypothetical protein INT45_009462 [Circinella minor]